MNKIKNGQLPLFEIGDDNLERNAKFPIKQATNYGTYIVYVDESGDHSLTSIDKDYPIFVLAFCVFHKRHYSAVIVPSLEKFKFNHVGHDQVVLHENEIRRRTGQFSIFNNRKQHQNFLSELTQIIDIGNFILISSVIKKKELKPTLNDKSNAYDIALNLCMDALYQFLVEKGELDKITHIVFECRGSKEDKDLELEFRRICDRGSLSQKRMPFEVLFSDKKVMSTGLQLADLVARPIGLKILRPQQNNRAFEVLERKFYCEGGREKVGENYLGRGLKIYPSIDSEKPR